MTVPYIRDPMPHEMDPKPRLGHLWKLTIQERYGQDDRLGRDRKVWVSCTCGWFPSPSFADEPAALAYFYNVHRPNDAPVNPGKLFDGDDPGGRGAAEDAELRARIGER